MKKEDDDAGDDALSATEIKSYSEESVVDALVSERPPGAVGEQGGIVKPRLREHAEADDDAEERADPNLREPSL